MSTNIILDLADLCKLIDGGEVWCKVGDKSIVLSVESDVTNEINLIYKGIGQMDGGHRVAVNGREYVDKIIFQTHLEEQVLNLLQENGNGNQV